MKVLPVPMPAPPVVKRVDYRPLYVFLAVVVVAGLWLGFNPKARCEVFGGNWVSRGQVVSDDSLFGFHTDYAQVCDW